MNNIMTYNGVTGWVLRTKHTLNEYIQADIVIDIDELKYLKHGYLDYSILSINKTNIRKLLELSTYASRFNNSK